MYTNAEEFHVEEYKQLRSEVVGLLAKIDLYLRYSVLVPAAVYSWILLSAMGVHKIDVNGAVVGAACLKMPLTLVSFAWVIPPVFVLYCGLISLSIAMRVGQFGTYLRILEGALGDSRLGWESFNLPLASRLTWIHRGVWIALLFACVAATAVGTRHAMRTAVLCVPT